MRISGNGWLWDPKKPLCLQFFPLETVSGISADVFVRRFKDCLGWISAGKWIERPLAIPCRGAGNGDVFVMTFEVSDGPKPHFSSIDHSQPWRLAGRTQVNWEQIPVKWSIHSVRWCDTGHVTWLRGQFSSCYCYLMMVNDDESWLMIMYYVLTGIMSNASARDISRYCYFDALNNVSNNVSNNVFNSVFNSVLNNVFNSVLNNVLNNVFLM